MARYALLMVAAAAAAVATEWEPVSSTPSVTKDDSYCTPTPTWYECDQEDGSVSTTSWDIYPTDCPEYKPFPDQDKPDYGKPGHGKPDQGKPGKPDQGKPGKPDQGKPESDYTWSAITTPAYDTKTWSVYAEPTTTSTWASWASVDYNKDHGKECYGKDDKDCKDNGKNWDYGKDKDHKGKGKGEKVVTVTLTEVYTVPCETGWATSTSTIYTTWCGCTETPKPEHPEYKTYTTECPESWGVGKTVTVTVPTASWTPVADDQQTWSTYATPADNTQTWNTYATPAANAQTWSTWASASVADTASTWATAAVSTPVAAESCAYTTTAIVTSSCASWAAWDSSKTGSQSCTTSTSWSTIYPATCTGTWAAAPVAATNTWATIATPVSPTNATWAPVAAYTGAASSSNSDSVLLMLGGAVAGIAYLL